MAGHTADMVPPVDLFGADNRHIRLVTDSPIPSVISNPRLSDNPIVACNAAFCELTGYSTEEVVGRNCRFLSGPATEPWLTEEIRRGVREHRPVLVEILNYKRNGQPFRNAVLVAPIYDEHDALLYFLGSQVEIDSAASAPSSMRRIRAAEMVKALSPRQGQVLKLVANGLLNKQIAAELDLAEKTVKMLTSSVWRSKPASERAACDKARAPYRLINEHG
jgi:PAS domain S-box-containing protein